MHRIDHNSHLKGSRCPRELSNPTAIRLTIPYPMPAVRARCIQSRRSEKPEIVDRNEVSWSLWRLLLVMVWNCFLDQSCSGRMRGAEAFIGGASKGAGGRKKQRRTLQSLLAAGVEADGECAAVDEGRHNARERPPSVPHVGSHGERQGVE